MMCNEFENRTFEIAATYPRGQWVKSVYRNTYLLTEFIR